MADGYIDIDVRLNESPANAQAAQIGQQLGQQVSQAVQSASQGAQKSTKQALGEIGGTLTSFGAAYSKAVTLPIAAAAVASGASAVKIDTALTGVRKTVDGTEQQYEALKDAAIEFSQTNAVDPAQILDIQALGAQLGFTVDELGEFSEVISGLDLSTNLDASEAASSLAQLSNIMGTAHEDIRRYGSTIVELGNTHATTEADITSMAMRIAGAGKQIGLTEADVLGLSTALASMGINAEAGGSAISTIMSRIDKDVALGTDSLETWAQTANMSVEEFTKAWGEDAVGALSAVLVGMDAATQSGGNMSVMLQDLGINEIRQTDTLKRLASNSEFLGKAVDTANTAWEENIALDKEVENRNNSMASQLEILKNKLMAAGISMGEVLVPALIDIIEMAEPLIQALQSGAKAFSDLDEEQQRIVVTAIAVAAAFGPMTSLLGKSTSFLASNADRWRAFGENLRTVKTNLANTTTEITKQAAAQGQYKTVMIGGQQATVKYNSATKQMTVIQSANTNATKAQTVAMKASTAATKAGALAMNVAQRAGKLLSATMLNIAPMVVITAIMAISTAISDMTAEAEEARKATDGIRNAMDSYHDAFANARTVYEDVSTGARGYSDSLYEVRSAADEAIAKQSELADKMAESFSEVGTNSALVSNYADTVERLTNKYGEQGEKIALTAQEQGELITAVEGLNDIMGTSYSVVDAQNGVLSANTEEILKSADAWQKRALMEAQSAAVQDIMAQKLEITTALTAAEKNLTDAQQQYNDAVSAGATDLTPWNEKLTDAKAEVDRLTEADKALDDQQNALNESVAKLNAELSSSAESLSGYVEATGAWSEALSNAGIGAGDFAQKLSDIGVSTENLNTIMSERGAEGIQQFVDKYKEGGTALQDWLINEFGINLSTAVQGATDQAAASAQAGGQATGQGFTAGLSAEAQSVVNAALETVGMTVSEFDKLAEQAGIEGDEGAMAFANSIANGEWASRNAGQINETAALQPMQDLKNQSGVAGTEGATQFHECVALEAPESEAAGRKNADDAATGFQSQKDNASGWGWDLVDNFAKGISGAVDLVRNAANFVMGVVSSIMGFSVPDAGPFSGAEQGGERSGRHLVQNFAAGMLSGKADAVAAAHEIAQDISDELMNEFYAVDPMAQIGEAIAKGTSAINVAAMVQGTGDVYNTNNNNFYGSVESPDAITREMRMQQMYGLAGENVRG